MFLLTVHSKSTLVRFVYQGDVINHTASRKFKMSVNLFYGSCCLFPLQLLTFFSKFDKCHKCWTELLLTCNISSMLRAFWADQPFSESPSKSASPKKCTKRWMCELSRKKFWFEELFLRRFNSRRRQSSTTIPVHNKASISRQLFKFSTFLKYIGQF